MDIDNFEFKPLTQGLGFDKKAEETKATLSTPLKTSPLTSPKTTPKASSAAPTSTSSGSGKATPKTSASVSSAVSAAASSFLGSDTSSSFNTKSALTNDGLGVKNKLNLDFEDEEVSAKGDGPDLFEKPLDWNTNPPKTSKSITEMLNALPPSIDFFDEDKAVKQKETKVYKPIGRVEYTPGSREMIEPVPAVETNMPTTGEKVDVSLDNTLEKAFPKVGFRRPFFHQAVEVQPQFTEIPNNFTSAVLDALVISGLTALLLVGLILLTGIDLIAVVMHSRASLSIWAELGAIYLGVYLLYYMCFRGFWGSTLGDWAFDIQLGTVEEQTQWYYPYQVVWRMIGIAASGFILLPILSLILKKDVAQSYSKLRLYIKNY